MHQRCSQFLTKYTPTSKRNVSVDHGNLFLSAKRLLNTLSRKRSEEAQFKKTNLIPSFAKVFYCQPRCACNGPCRHNNNLRIFKHNGLKDSIGSSKFFF